MAIEKRTPELMEFLLRYGGHANSVVPDLGQLASHVENPPAQSCQEAAVHETLRVTEGLKDHPELSRIRFSREPPDTIKPIATFLSLTATHSFGLMRKLHQTLIRRVRAFATGCLLLSASQVLALDSAVVFNEVQYHPANELTQTEWIEIKSNQGVDIDISGWSITGGVNFTFPANTVLSGNSLLVIATIPAQIPGAIGPMTGSLDNGGETLRIRNRNGRIIDELSYADDGDWPLAADGLGFTLARRHSAVAGTGTSAWASSQQAGGTPGGVNFSTAAINHNLVVAGTIWKYRDDAAAPPAGWEAHAFDDSTWLSGAAPLGGTATLTATTHLVERFRASAITGLTDGQTVATWADLATGDGVAQDAVAASTTPTYRASSTPNGKPAVRFDGNDMARTSLSPGIASGAGWSVFMVVKANGAQPNIAYLLDRVAPSQPKMSLYAVNGYYALQKRHDDNSGQSDIFSTTSISTTEWQVVTIRRNPSLSRFEIWVNGVMEATELDPGGALTPNPIVIGRHGSNTDQGFNGDIAEVLVYNDSLSDADFQSAGYYLAREYALPSPKTALNASTSQLRKTFTFTGNPANTTLRLNCTVADGAVFYLNGTELTRVNMPSGPIDHTTAASSVIASPAASGFFAVPASGLLNGTNVLAVSLHKANIASNSYFDAALTATEIPGSSASLIFSEIASALDPDFFIELKNPSATAVSTSGWGLLTSTGQSISLPIRNVAPGGYVTFSAAELGLAPVKDLRLVLSASNGSVFGDARSVTNSLRGLTSSGLWGHPSAPSSDSANTFTVSNAIVINEIFYQGLGTSTEQWVELYNRSANPVDLAGWTFSEGIDYTFLPGTILPAGGYVVVAWDPAAFAALHPGKTALGPFSGSLSGKGETLSLSDANENIVNSVRYGDGGLWSEWADGGGSSLELKDPYAANSNPGAWDASDESTKTPWQTVTYSGTAALDPTNEDTTWNEFIFGMLDVGEVLVDDVSVKNVTKGNIELIQNGSFSSNSSFWRIVGNHYGSIVPDPTNAGNNVLKIVATSATDSLYNQANTTLKSGSTFHTLVATDTYSISFRAKWLRGSNRLHSRLYCNRLPRQTLLTQPLTGGTPGAVNSRFIANIGPTFDSFGHAPVVPAANAAATVTVNVADSDAVTSVQLFTSVSGAAFTSANMTEADGVYSGTIAGKAAGTIVQFYVRATDSLGAVSYFPPNGPASRALIQWADGRALTTLPSGAKPHNLRVIMTGADANNMYKLENLMSNADVPCTVVWDESIVYYRAGAQLKGSKHSRWQIVRVGYNLTFPADDLFLGVHSGIALDRSGDSNGEPGQEEILLKTLMNLAGGTYTPEEDLIRLIPAKATGSGYLYDGSAMLGACMLSKTRLKDDFLEGQFDNGDDGMLFKYDAVYTLNQTINPITRVIDPAIVPENPKIANGYSNSPFVSLENLGANKEIYRWHWIVENGRKADNYADLINALTAIGQAGGSAAFNTQTAQYLDVSPWLRATIPPALFGVSDNYLGDGYPHNVFIYFPPGGKAQLFPWDMDYLNQGNPTAATLTVGGDLSKFLANPVYKRLYWGHMLDILNRSFNTTVMTKWATHYSKFSSADMVPMVSSYLTPRAAYARTQVNAAIPPVTFAVSSPANNASVNASSVTVTGSGWINVSEIRLDGSPEPLEVTWISATGFTLRLPLGPGTKIYTLKAYSPEGTVLASITRTYTNTSAILPAVAGTIAVTELNFNPASSTDREEFIELTNMSGNTLDLSYCHFDETGQGGVAYTFPLGTQLAVGGRIIIVRDRTAYQAAYGNLTNVAPNQWDAASALSNGGETLTLYAANGTLIFSFAYTDNLNAADGGGYSLVRVLAATNPNLATYLWRSSTTLGGNPGGTDAIIVPGDPLADADSDGYANWVEAALGTSDTAGSSLPKGVVLSPGTHPGEFIVTSGVLPNADHVIATIETSPDLITWTTIASGSSFSGSGRFFRLRLVQR